MRLSRAITDSIAKRPQDTVMVYPGRDISGEEFLALTASCALALKEKGIKAGDWVAVCSTTTAEAVAAAIACHNIGAAVMMVNPAVSDGTICSILKDSGTRLIFVHEMLIDRIRQGLKGSGIETGVIISDMDSMPAALKLLRGFGVIPHNEITSISGMEFVVWNEFIKKTDPDDAVRILDETEEETDPETPALLVWSSGSTGEPKGVLLSERALLAQLNITGFDPFTDKGTAFAALGSLWSATAYIITILVMLVMPRKIVMPLGQPMTDLITKQGADMVFSTASGWIRTISSGSLDKADISRLEFTACGGERTAPAAERAVNAYFREHGCRCELTDLWGLSEFSSLMTDNISNNKKGSVGRPFHGIRIEAFDPVRPSLPLERGHSGELFAESPAVMSGYYGDDKATEEFFFTDEEGVVWGRTGDAGYVDSEGYVYVYGRRDSAIYPDGVSVVYPSEIENVLAEDARVLNCAVVISGAGGEITAHIYASAQDETEQAALTDTLKGLCKSRLSKDRRPERYIYWPKGLPLNEFGKIARNELKEYT
ncbi:MAG: acyl--CoA ligase [Clostridiales bacterium]|jgi:long-chain acyl-CoA synthetase|nr:acyl--CoA ligase [Clostridiales bacterium]